MTTMTEDEQIQQLSEAAEDYVRQHQASDLQPLTDDEAALVYHTGRYGSDGYPVQKVGSKHWGIGPWRSWDGFPRLYPTKREAVAQFERWLDLALKRWAEMKRAEPDLILTAVGIRGREVAS